MSDPFGVRRWPDRDWCRVICGWFAFVAIGTVLWGSQTRAGVTWLSLVSAWITLGAGVLTALRPERWAIRTTYFAAGVLSASRTVTYVDLDGLFSYTAHAWFARFLVVVLFVAWLVRGRTLRE